MLGERFPLVPEGSGGTPFLQLLVNFGSKIFHFDRFTIDLKFLHIAEATLLFLVFWFFNGLAFFFLLKGLFTIQGSLLLSTIGIFAVSSVIGLLSFITPAGLGVKEGALSFLLSLHMPLSIAIFASLLSRVCIILVEVLRLGVVVIIKRFVR